MLEISSTAARRRPALLLLFGALVVPLSMGGQEPPPEEGPRETFEERLEVVEVLLDVVVTDRRGRPVTGLDAGDFLVEENGRPVEILGVMYESYRPPAAFDPLQPADRVEPDGRRVVELPLPEAPAGRRLFLLLFHDLLRSDRETLGVLSHQLRAAEGAREWVREELGPGDLVAVLRYDYKLWLYQDFTGDREALIEAIDRTTTRKSPRDAGPAPDAPSLGAHLPPGDQLRDESTTLRKALKTLGWAAGEVPGRKHLLLFSIGIGLEGPDRGLLTRGFVPTMAEVLVSNDVTVYSLDLTPPEVEHEKAAAMAGVAESTGGLYFSHLRGFAKTLEILGEQLSGAYLISYRTRLPRGEQGFRTVTVRTRDPDLVVLSRQGYLHGE